MGIRYRQHTPRQTKFLYKLRRRSLHCLVSMALVKISAVGQLILISEMVVPYAHVFRSTFIIRVRYELQICCPHVIWSV